MFWDYLFLLFPENRRVEKLKNRNIRVSMNRLKSVEKLLSLFRNRNEIPAEAFTPGKTEFNVTDVNAKRRAKISDALYPNVYRLKICETLNTCFSIEN